MIKNNWPLFLALPSFSMAQGHGRIEFAQFFFLPKVWLGLLFALLGVFLLVRGITGKRTRLSILALIVFVFGVLPALPLGEFSHGMGLHPSPMCAITKPLLFGVYRGFVPHVFLAMLIFMLVLSIIGRKLFCGWVCPVGAAQEIMLHIPVPRQWRFTPPFWMMNVIRGTVLASFIALALLVGMDIYAYFNPFHFFHFRFDFYSVWVFTVVLLASIFIFRPFCYLICPVGLVTWLLEPLSVFKLKVQRENCKECVLCAKKSDCSAVGGIVNKKRIHADCFSCGRCMSVCRKNAMKYKMGN